MEQPVHGLCHVVGEREVLGKPLEDLVRRQADLLGSVPGGVAEAQHDFRCYLTGGRKRTPRPETASRVGGTDRKNAARWTRRTACRGRRSRRGKLSTA